MRRRLTYGLTLMLALAALVLPPWLALREARRQAFDAEAMLTLGYARDVLHRTDETGRQALAGIAALQDSGLPPCSTEARKLMREIDLTSTYLQAIGYMRDGVLVCSSMTGAPVPLGPLSFRTSTGNNFYLQVPVRSTRGHPLLAMERGITFDDGRHLVSIVRSRHYLTAAVAATPINYLQQRYRDTAMRLVPVSVFAGLAAATASASKRCCAGATAPAN